MQSHELLREVLERTSAKSPTNRKLPLAIYNGPSRLKPAAVPPTVDRTRWSGIKRPSHCPVGREKAGGFFIRNRATWPHPFYLIPATNRGCRSRRLLSVIAVAATDNEVTPDEAKKIRAGEDSSRSRRPGALLKRQLG